MLQRIEKWCPWCEDFTTYAQTHKESPLKTCESCGRLEGEQ